jgi:hypothetical protein
VKHGVLASGVDSKYRFRNSALPRYSIFKVETACFIPIKING